ncbi:MAG: hypothetical protein ACYS0D_04980, partial [Planctomycetota bacterium]
MSRTAMIFGLMAAVLLPGAHVRSTDFGEPSYEGVTPTSPEASAARAALVLHVDDNAPPGGDGLTWETAFKDLQDALYAAFLNPEVNEIRVAGGTYYPDRGTGIREFTFQLLNGLAVYGGYRGCPTGDCSDNAQDEDPYDRNIEAFESILSGEIGVPELTTDNSYHVVSGTGNDS